ncbi:hypothetical protein GTZ99_12550 [Novosphingobium sp. FSY-8]|uniref:YdaS antitoxin of YdaST toxin-antitoxin system n=1 Tax=Novosphingobium ovatum TaxID=1908523 RepID=A0ABW9XFU0_9SPHN|nr:hypothetical protein [Novosphingobium ovatum]NBC37381.1 hypothetical protein [Novosphingobium ovatum]
MRTLYAACLSRLGLSQAEAATLHGVRLDTVKSWSAGRNPVPQGAWDQLRQAEAAIIERAETIREAWELNGSPPIEINTDGADASSLMAAADFVLGSTGPVHVGETAATRTARQARRPVDDRQTPIR